MTSTRTLMTAGLSALFLAACGGGGHGTLSLQLTDAPPETAAMKSAVVTISRVEAHFAGAHVPLDAGTDGGTAYQDDDRDEGGKGKGKDGKDDDGYDHGGWYTVMGAPRSFDLLALQNDVTAALGELELPAGKITQIRLYLDEAGRNEITLKTGQVCPLDMSHVDRKGIKINHPFKALQLEHGKRVEVVLDFDLKESVDQQATCVYRLKPVIKIKRVQGDNSGSSKGKGNGNKPAED